MLIMVVVWQQAKLDLNKWHLLTNNFALSPIFHYVLNAPLTLNLVSSNINSNYRSKLFYNCASLSFDYCCTYKNTKCFVEKYNQNYYFIKNLYARLYTFYYFICKELI